MSRASSVPEREPRLSSNLTLVSAILAAVMLTVAAAIACPAEAQKTGGSSISGRVVRTGTGEPLPGAEVSVHAAAATVRTDGEGHFVIGGLAPGRYSLEVRLHGYVDQALTVEVEAGHDPAALTVTLSPLARFLSEVVVTPSRFSTASAWPVSSSSAS